MRGLGLDFGGEKGKYIYKEAPFEGKEFIEI
jgi:hypothetical protein